MSATLIDGSPAWLDEAGGQYQNRIETDRVVWWQAAGARQGIVRGFEHSVVAGQMALEFSAGLALVEERDALDALGTHRGYVVWSDAAQVASFDVASVGARTDAVVLAFVDTNAGSAALGTGTTTVGGQIVVVPGESGVLTSRTDAQIAAYVGSGGWVRVLDVAIPAGSTEIGAGNVTTHAQELPESAAVVASAATTLTTTAAVNIPGLTYTTRVRDGEVLLVDVSLDTRLVGTGASFIVEVTVDGVAETPQMVGSFQTNGFRSTLSKRYRLDGLTVGSDHTVRVTGKLGAAAGSWEVFAGNSTMTVERRRS